MFSSYPTPAHDPPPDLASGARKLQRLFQPQVAALSFRSMLFYMLKGVGISYRYGRIVVDK
jgi:hypothetical protein